MRLEMEHEWMTVKQTADYLQLSKQTVRRYIAEGKLQATQIVPNGKIRISSSSIDNMPVQAWAPTGGNVRNPYGRKGKPKPEQQLKEESNHVS